MDPRLGRAGLGLAVAGAATLALSLAYAQQGPENTGPVSLPPPPPVIQVPSNTAAPVTMLPPPSNEAAPPPPPRVKTEAAAPENEAAPEKPAPPPGPPPPTRSPTAILRVLDKVTAETLRFEAPVGRRVRYKTLIFVVKTCETRGLNDPLPRPSAYVIVDLEPPAEPGLAAPPVKEIYRGWMYAAAPGLHLFEHPVYDAWLEGCTSETPPA
jgi:hypothetical protein